MNARSRRGVAAAAGLFLAIQLGALALLPTFYAQGYQAVENPSNPVNSVVYVAAILVATVVMLAAFRYDLRWVVRGLVTLSAALVSWYVFGAFLGLLGAVPAALVAVALLAHPEWYVIDGAGIVMGAGAGALFGISFGPLPALLLLVVLAVYDAVSVYGTEHMLDLAEGVMDLRLPVILVVPMSLSYSLLEDDFEGTAGRGDDDAATDESGDGAESTPTDDGAPERDALFIGLGDAVIPTVLVASAAFFSPAPSLGVPGLAVNLPALLAMVGVFVGLGLLLRAVLRGRAHAGLPLLNGGAVAGYLLGSVLSGVPLVTALGLAPYL
jgi:presenilin-like A22 family membrane protease